MWEIEKDPSDGQFDLLRNGQVVATALPDERAVARKMRDLGASDDDTVYLPGGQVREAIDFIDRHL